MNQTVEWQPLQDSQVLVGFVLLLSGPHRPVTLLALPLGTLQTSSVPQKIVDQGLHLSNKPIPLAGQGQLHGEQNLVTLVESALKRLYDFSYLGQHPLTQFSLVRSRWEGEQQPVISLDRAKAVSTFLAEIIERLRPIGPLPKRGAIPCREWHPYLILYQAYMQEEHNYTIMNWLQISEGTFNRTRRRALQIVAKTVAELEWQAEAKVSNEINAQ